MAVCRLRCLAGTWRRCTTAPWCWPGSGAGWTGESGVSAGDAADGGEGLTLWASLRSSLRFGDAFECMRKLRINLNFLHDHNPKVRGRGSAPAPSALLPWRRGSNYRRWLFPARFSWRTSGPSLPSWTPPPTSTCSSQSSSKTPSLRRRPSRRLCLQPRVSSVFREEDTASGMYPRPDGGTGHAQPAAGPGKVDVVCDALRVAMETLDPNKSVLR